MKGKSNINELPKEKKEKGKEVHVHSLTESFNSNLIVYSIDATPTNFFVSVDYNVVEEEYEI